MANPLAARLSHFIDLTASDRDALDRLCENVRHVPRHRDVIAEGDRPEHVHLVLDGWAMRYKLVRDGARQITAFLFPGDFCDMHVTVLAEMDHGIGALTDVKVAYLSRDRLEAFGRANPHLEKAFWWSTLVDEAVLRSWIVNLGRRNALERLAHLLCELHLRLTNVDAVAGSDRFRLPLTQEQIADATGLTPVHVNRTLRVLREDGLIGMTGGDLTILDLDRLRYAGGFDPNYLHLRPKRGGSVLPVF